MVETLEPNEMQAKFIYAPIDKPICVLAPPGSGKTWASERRISFLLKNGALPRDILYVTFSKDMATSGLERILATNPELYGTDAEKQICTIHAICYRMLGWNGDSRQVAKEWKIKSIIQQHAEGDKFNKALWEDAKSRPGWKEIYSWICRVKSLPCDEQEFPMIYDEQLGAYHGERLTKIRVILDRELRRQKFLTFPDMLRDIEQKLLNDANFRKEYQNRFKWILVDEGQDTNGQAMRILSILAEPQKQFMIIGDADQLLYRFTGATPEENLYNGFEERYPDGLLVKMDINYRSTQTIIDKSQEVIKNNYAAYEGPYDDKYFKDVNYHDGAKTGEDITFVEYETPEDEAYAAVDDIATKIAQGADPEQFFIAARTRAQLGYLESPLVRAKIPYLNITGGSFWLMKHIQDVIAYVRLAINSDNKAAFKRVFNISSKWMTHPHKKSEHFGQYCHHRFLGRAFLDVCKTSYKNIDFAIHHKDAWRFRAGVDDLNRFIDDIKMELEIGNITNALEYVIDNSIVPWMKADEGIAITDEAENGKLEDFKTLLDLAKGYGDAEKFLAHVSSMERAARDVKDRKWDKRVIVSTIHRLKGQERDYVYGIGCSEGVEIDKNTKVETPIGLLPHTFSLKPPPQMGVLPSGGMGRVEDERCIFFVLISRAKKECHLSGVKAYRKGAMFPSRFVREIGLGYSQGDQS